MAKTNVNHEKIGNELLRIKGEFDELSKAISDARLELGENFGHCMLKAKAELLGAKAALFAKELDETIARRF